MHSAIPVPLSRTQYNCRMQLVIHVQVCVKQETGYREKHCCSGTDNSVPLLVFAQGTCVQPQIHQTWCRCDLQPPSPETSLDVTLQRKGCYFSKIRFPHFLPPCMVSLLLFMRPQWEELRREVQVRETWILGFSWKHFLLEWRELSGMMQPCLFVSEFLLIQPYFTHQLDCRDAVTPLELELASSSISQVRIDSRTSQIQSYECVSVCANDAKLNNDRTPWDLH